MLAEAIIEPLEFSRIISLQPPQLILVKIVAMRPI